MTVNRKALEPLDCIADGAAGTVYRTGYHLPGNPADLAYKEFHRSTLPPNQIKQAIDDFQRAVMFRQALAPNDKADLDSRTVWPLEMVSDGRDTTGGLMPLIPSDCFAQVHPQAQQTQSIPRGLQWLSAKTALALRSGFSQRQLDEFSDAVVRTAILAQLVYDVAKLHKHGLVYGDISLTNAVFSPNPPRVILIDCDPVAPLSDTSRQQLHSPQFCPPECLSVGSNPYARGNLLFQDTRTDVYKLALCVVRGLSQGRGATHLTNADHLFGTLDNNSLQTIRQALSDNPDARPTAKDLYLALAGFVASKTQPPVIKDFHAVSTVVPRDQDLLLLWDVENADSAFVHGPDGFSVTVDPAWGQCPVTVRKSGIYTLEVQKKRGSGVSQSTEFIQTFDIPPFDANKDLLLQLMPEIPALEPVDITSVLEGLPARPTVDIGTDFIPDIPMPSAETFLSQLDALTGSISSVDLVNKAISSYRPPTFDQVSQIGNITSNLDAGSQIVRKALSDAQDLIEVSLQQAISDSMQDAVDRIEAGVTRQVNAMQP